MRNLTKVLALVLALTMVVGVAAFAASYTDVEKNANYAEAVSVLSDLGLVKGYEDGTFGADKTLTRAEATAFVLRLMNLEEAAVSNAGADTGFSDVPADHWAAGYIYTAKTNNVVSGNGDGTFAPDANLTFAQIVKMIVVALGYNPLAAELGEWPGNYITAGSQIKLTTGIAGKADEEVTRATTARLLYSALSIPKMEKKGVGVNATWEPGSTLILDDLGFYKVKGYVEAVDLDNDRATIFVDKQGFANEKGKYVETTKDMTIEATEDDEGDFRVTAKLGNLGKSLKDLVKVPAYIYIANGTDGYVVASVVEQSAKVDTVEFVSSDYASFEAPKLKYYTNEAQTKTATIKLADTLDVVANGGELTEDVAADTFVTTITSEVTIVELKDTDADGKYDYAVTTAYEYMIVDEIKVKNDVYTFTALSDDLDYAKIKVDTEDEDLYLTIIKDGSEIELDEIETGDVLNIVAPVGGIDTYGNVSNATIYVTNEKVEGTVKYVDEDTVALKDGTELKSAIVLEKGDEGIFVLGILGNIIYLDTENVESSLVYGYATVATLDANRTTVKTADLRVLGTDGTWATIDFAEKVAINDADSTKMLTIINSGDFIGTDDIDANNEAFIFGMVAYELDSNGAIKTLITEDFEDYNADVDATYIEDEEENRLGGYYVGEGTAIYSIKADAMEDDIVEEDEIKVTDISVLKDGKDYTDLVAYDIDEDDSFINILFGTFEADVDIESAMFVVTKAVLTTLDEDEDTDVIKLTGYQEGEAVVYYYEIGESVVNNLVFDTLTVGTAVASDALAAGDVLFVNADADGIIAKAVKFANVTEKFTDAGALNTSGSFAAVLSSAVTEDAEGYFVHGYVYGKEKTKVYVDAAYADVNADDFDETVADEELAVNSKTAVTVYDLSYGKNPVVDGSTSDIEEGTVIYGRTNANGTLVEVIVVKAK